MGIKQKLEVVSFFGGFGNAVILSTLERSTELSIKEARKLKKQLTIAIKLAEERL